MTFITCSICGDTIRKKDSIDLTLRIVLDGANQYLSVEGIANMLLNKVKHRTMSDAICKTINITHSKCIRTEVKS